MCWKGVSSYPVKYFWVSECLSHHFDKSKAAHLEAADNFSTTASLYEVTNER